MKRVIKAFAIVAGMLLALAILVGSTLWIRAGQQLKGAYEIQPEPVTLPKDEASLARGEHIARVTCAGCHGQDYGGEDLFTNEMLGYIPAPNLTSGGGGIGGAYTVDDWIRALRNGVGPDGQPFVVMPADALRRLGDADMAALVAYMQQLTPVDRTLPKRRFTPLGQALIGAGAFGSLVPAREIEHDAPPPAAPVPGLSAEYGEYWVNITNCGSCHGEQLSGGKDPDPGAPVAPNLTPGGALAGWREADFIAAMRTGQKPDGATLSPYMPWDTLRHISDDELSAVWLYLQSLPALESTAP